MGTFNGTTGNDTITGGAGIDDTISGFAGDDVLGTTGSPSDKDRIDGGSGNDTLFGGDGDDQLIGGSGNDSLDAGSGDDSLDGGPGNDILDGSFGNDDLIGGTGDDTLTGGGFGDNTLDGGDGNDSILGGTTEDLITGGSGNDSIDGGSNNDTIDGGDDNDTIAGGTGSDSITGGLGDDVLDGDDQNDRIDGGAGADTIDGGSGNDDLIGGTGDDFLDGGGFGDNTLDGGAGNDSILGGDTEDTITGGTGNDNIDGGNNNDTIDGGDDNDTVAGGTGDDTITGGLGDDVLNGGGNDDSIDGGAGTDTLDGGDDDDTVDGGAGTDTIYGRQAADTLKDGVSGDNFADTFYPGSGMDSVNVGTDSVLDTVSFFDDGGELAITQGINANLVAGTVTDGWNSLDTIAGTHYNLEGSQNNDIIVGNPANTAGTSIFGNAGNDTISGADTFYPGSGSDSITGDGNADVLSYDDSQNPNADASGAATLGAVVDMSMGTATDGWGNTDSFTGITDVTGGALNDSITGDSLANTLRGGGGNDSLMGGDGPDTLVGGAGTDTLDGGAGTDTATFAGNSADYSIVPTSGTIVTITITDLDAGSFGDDGSAIVSNVENIIFNDGPLSLSTGSSGADTIDRTGATPGQSYGGGGNDTYIVDGAEDEIFEDPSGGQDTVQSGTTWTLDTNFENLTLTGTGNTNGTGNAADNSVTGNSGDNTLMGLGGNDTLNGGAGNDTLVGGLGTDTLDGGDGNDHLTGGASPDGVVDIINGGTGDDTFGDSENIDIITGGDGMDIVEVMQDYISVADGNLVTVEYVNSTGFGLTIDLSGQSEGFKLNGDAGNNVLTGGAGDDEILGASGNDTINGGDGEDIAVFSGNADDYEIVVSSETVTVTHKNMGSDGIDILSNIETLRFADQDITVESGTEVDDSLDLTDEDGDIGAGGAGDDTYFVDDIRDLVIELFGEGNDTIITTITLTLPDNVENLILRGTEAIDAIGNALDNFLEGNSNNNVLFGLLGIDELFGGFGDDILDGGPGGDFLAGGPGNDTYFIDSLLDIIFEDTPATLGFASARSGIHRRGGPGEPVLLPDDVSDNIDQVISTVSFALTDFVENLTLDGTSDIDGSGNELNNVVIGNTGNNVLSTGDGALDSLSGGDGADNFVIDKVDGRTVVKDTPGDADVLDLTIFAGGGELSFSDGIVGGLRIENATGGVVELDGFYGSDTTSIQFIDTGDGPMDVSSARTAEDVANALSGTRGTLIDDDGNLFDAQIEASDGTVITATEAQVVRTYLGGLGRDPDPGGFDFWVAEIDEGRRDLTGLAEGFVFSEEFQGLADTNGDGSLNTEEFLNHMYQNVFGRAPDEGGFAFWSNELDSGNRTQANVLADMTQSNEYVEMTVNQVVDYLV